MEVQLNLADTHTWKLKISEDYTEMPDDNISLNLDLIEINRIKEPYTLLSDPKEVENVVASIKKESFLHPIIAFKSKNKEFILADGTHRIEALKHLRCKLIPAIVVQEEDIDKDAWVKIIKSKAPHYKSIYKTISPNQRKNIVHQEFDLLSIDSLIEFQYKKDLIAVYKDGRHIHIFSFSNLTNTNRKEKLRLMKYFDETLDSDDKKYTLISKLEEEEFNFSKYLMIPPPQDALEFEQLVLFSELRRPKAFRIRTPIRLVHLPIPIEILQKERNNGMERLQFIINQKLKDFKSIFLKLSFSKSLDISWYYHILLIGSRENFLKDVSNEERDLINQLLDNVSLNGSTESQQPEIMN